MRQDVSILLDADTHSRLAAPGHDLTITHTRWEWAKATVHEVRCDDCKFGRTRAVRDRDEASTLASFPLVTPDRRNLARRAVLAPLLDDFARAHVERSTG